MARTLLWFFLSTLWVLSMDKIWAWTDVINWMDSLLANEEFVVSDGRKSCQNVFKRNVSCCLRWSVIIVTDSYDEILATISSISTATFPYLSEKGQLIHRMSAILLLLSIWILTIKHNRFRTHRCVTAYSSMSWDELSHRYFHIWKKSEIILASFQFLINKWLFTLKIPK